MRYCFLIVASLGLFISSCKTAEQRWAEQFSPEQKIQTLYERGLAQFSEAKQTYNKSLLEKAKVDFAFLQQEYKHAESAERLKEIALYEQDVISYYSKSAQEAMNKKKIADAAGYYKRLLAFDSSNVDAKKYLADNDAEIKRQIQSSVAEGNGYLKKKQYVKARRVFERLKLVAPSSEIDSTLSQIAVLKAEQDKRRRIAAAKAASQQKSEEPVVTEAEREKIYASAKIAFESKDYLKAYELFSTLERNYKDTSLYLDRAADKIEALGLSEETN